MQKEELRNYLFIAVILILVFTSYKIVQSFIIPIISAFVLAYLLKPINNFLSKRINKHLSAFICILIVILFVIGIFSFLVGSLISQASQSLELNELEKNIYSKLSDNKILNSIGLDLESLKERGIELFISILSSNIINLPILIIGILITILSTYYLLVNWEYLSSQLKQFLPFKDKEKVSREISDSTNNIIYGYFLIAIIEFVIGVIGFYFSGVSYYILLPVLMAILAFIPGIGPGLIWAPLGIYHIFQGSYITAIGVIITGLIISVVVETLLFGKIIGNKSKIHPLIILIGIFGGVPIFGIFGFIIGPLVLVYTIKLLKETIKEN